MSAAARRRAAADNPERNLGRSVLWLFKNRVNALERALNRIDPFFADVALSLRSLIDSVPRSFLELDVYRQQYDDGDPGAILRAIACAIQCRLPPPAWAATAFVERFRRYADPAHGAPSLDELFTDGRARSRRGRAQHTHDWRLGADLWEAVCTRLARGQDSSFSAALQQVLAARKWGVGATKARALVEAVERVQRPLIGGPALADYGRQAIPKKRPRSRKS